MTTKHLYPSLTDDEARAFKLLAALADKSQSDLVAELVRAFINSQHKTLEALLSDRS